MLKKLSNFINTGITSEVESKGFNSSSSYYQNGQINKGNKSADGFDFLHLIQSWSEIAGNKLSEHTIPLKNQNGTLTVLSNHSAFANEMKFMEVPLKRKIFQQFPNLENKIKTIHFIVDTTYFEKQMEIVHKSIIPKKMELAKPHPFSPEAKRLQKEADELFKNIDDLELKKTFESLYIQSKFNADK